MADPAQSALAGAVERASAGAAGHDRRLPADRLVGRPEWVTLGFLRERLESAPALRACRRELWTVDQLNGWPVGFPALARLQPVGNDARRAEAVARALEIMRPGDVVVILADDFLDVLAQVQPLVDGDASSGGEAG